MVSIFMIKRKNAKIILSESLIDIVKNRPITKITIEDIVNNCGYDRSVFYYHFINKNDLINWTFFYQTDEILEKYRDLEPWGEVLGRILVFLKEYNNLFSKVITLYGTNSFYDSYRKYTELDYLTHIKKTLHLSNKESLDSKIESAIKFNSYGALGYVKQWAERGMKEDPKSIGHILANSMPEILKQYFIF
jgi:AcrR family transcriptional regulator